MHINNWFPKNKYAFAWISPEGLVHVVDCLQHAEFFKNIPSLEEDYYQYSNEVDSNEDIVCSELDSLEDDEHPAMHRFFGINDNARDNLYLKAYNLGWLRFGYSSNCIEIYGREQYIHNYVTVFKKLKKDLNASLTFGIVVELKKKAYISSVFSYQYKHIK